eukprot:1985668-Alexandrium_andersonii.AAC.1
MCIRDSTMTAYHENLVPIAISAARRRDLDSPLQPRELKQFRAMCGSLQWLVSQLRFDVSFL